MNINEIPKKEMRKWIYALRSGKYKQTTGALQDERGYCCLGVACELFVPADEKRRDCDGHLVGANPYSQEASPEWLKGLHEDFCGRTGESLMTLNDNGTDELEPFTFEEIADLLEAVYILRVLED